MLSRTDESELQNLATINNNKKADFAIGAIDLIDVTAIFAMFLKEVLHNLLEHTLKFIMYPLAAAANLIRAGLSWRQAILEKNSSLFVKAGVDTVAALAITTAVIGTLFFTPIFATISPIIFTATLGSKALFHAGMAAFHVAKYITNPEEKEKHKQMAIGNSVAAVTNALIATAVGCVMLAKLSMVAVLGMTAGIFGAGFAIYSACTVASALKKTKQPASTDVPDLEKGQDNNEPNRTLSQNAEVFKKINAPQPNSSALESIQIVNSEKVEEPIALPSPKSSPKLFVVSTLEEAKPSTNNSPQFNLRKSS